MDEQGLSDPCVKTTGLIYRTWKLPWQNPLNRCNFLNLLKLKTHLFIP